MTEKLIKLIKLKIIKINPILFVEKIKKGKVLLSYCVIFWTT